MIHFDEAHERVHRPADRRLVLRVRQPYVIWLAVAIAVPVGLAWLQLLTLGIHSAVSPVTGITGSPSNGAPRGFPVWIRWTHFANFLFLFLLIRSGLSILVDHPRLYWSNDCTPGTEWLRFTPIELPPNARWTAKDDARYISPLLGLPGYRHTIGMARSWHFITDYGFVIAGAVYVAMLFISGQWPRLVPTSWEIFPYAWQTFVHYATFHFPVEPDGFFAYNALQQLSYFAVVFIMAPLSILTGIAMSPAVDNAFPWYPRIFGGRQGGRSIHFLLLCGYLGFTVIHVALVLGTGAEQNFNHIVLGVDDTRPLGLILGSIGIAAAVGSWMLAHIVAWRYPRAIQRLHRALLLPLELRLSRWKAFDPKERYADKDISPYFWTNGKMPDSIEWKRLVEIGFEDYRLIVSGCVERPLELGLEEIRALPHEEYVTLHHCIQGWSGVARWGGVSLRHLIELAKPLPSARAIQFVSFGDGIFGGSYYDTQRLEDAVKPECLLACDMNGAPLTTMHGAPLRLRVENQLGYKMVKWIREIRFVESAAAIGKGFGGKNEDDEFFDLLPYI